MQNIRFEIGDRIQPNIYSHGQEIHINHVYHIIDIIIDVGYLSNLTQNLIANNIKQNIYGKYKL